jgi:hypothetical protein
MAWGGLVRDEPGSEAWLEAGAKILAVLDGATPERLATLRAAIDRHERVALDAARRVDDAWQAHVGRAAAMAEGGPAVWLHDAEAEPPSRERLPAGFEWLVVDNTEVRRLPVGRFRLVVDRRRDGDAGHRAARWLADGGILASGRIAAESSDRDLRVLRIDEVDGIGLAILRREA